MSEYYRILDMFLNIVKENPTKEMYHVYNQFKEQLRKELNNDEEVNDAITAMLNEESEEPDNE